MVGGTVLRGASERVEALTGDALWSRELSPACLAVLGLELGIYEGILEDSIPLVP